MRTFKQLKNGEFKNAKHLKLSENLTSFPREIFDLVDTLEVLDLSNNLLCSLPEDMYKFKKLKILFLSFNKFTEVPSELKNCENLYMLGMKANQIQMFDEDILPLGISWLILTDNKLKKLPNSIGQLTKLQKVAFAGNQLEILPKSMSACVNIELIRLSANNLQEIPSWLIKLPKLSWLAFSGNPCSLSPDVRHEEIDFESLEVKELLGEGASGEIFKAYSKDLDKEVAIKLFKGAVTSDGYAKDEMDAYMHVKDHDNLIKVLAKVKCDERLGLILEYIPSSYKNLGNPPDFNTCTRDTFEDGMEYEISTIYTIVKDIASAAAHLHEHSLMHGDLYAHNILIDKQSCYLGDFGAASFYDKQEMALEKIEVRAYGCLIEDMLSLCNKKDSFKYKELDILKNKCMSKDIDSRPMFEDILRSLEQNL